MSEVRVTIEQLMEYSGYSIGMIYDLTHYGVLSPPVRGVDPHLYGSKGLYPECCFRQLDRYKALKLQGLKKAEIIRLMKEEGVRDVQVQQG